MKTRANIPATMNDKIQNKKLSPKEEEIMGVIWEHGPMFVREIIERLPDPKPHFNTVSTFVRALEGKGWLTHEQFGNTFRYSALVPVDDYRDKTVKGVVKRFFSDSYLGFVSALVKDEKITTEELRELIDMVEQNNRQGDE